MPDGEDAAVDKRRRCARCQRYMAFHGRTRLGFMRWGCDHCRKRVSLHWTAVARDQGLRD